MNKFLDKIYKSVITYEPDTVDMAKKIDGEVLRIIEPYKGDMTPEQQERLTGLIYEAVFIAEERAFWLGWKYALKAILAIFKG